MKIAQYFIKTIVLLASIVLVASCSTNKDYQTTKELFQAMKAKNDGSWFQNFRFKQHTLRFDTTGVRTDSTVWYESVSYPYNFRIDRNIEKNIYTIYRNDSMYNFRQDTLFNKLDQAAAHLVFKGGLYFIPLEESLEKLKKYGYETEIFREDSFMNQSAYVIGNDNNQIWLHAKNFYCMRRIYTTEDKQTVDVVYDNFKPLGKGFVEQQVTFYVDGKKRLEEFYFDIKTTLEFDKKIYDINENFKWYLNY